MVVKYYFVRIEYKKPATECLTVRVDNRRFTRASLSASHQISHDKVIDSTPSGRILNLRSHPTCE